MDFWGAYLGLGPCASNFKLSVGFHFIQVEIRYLNWKVLCITLFGCRTIWRKSFVRDSESSFQKRSDFPNATKRTFTKKHGEGFVKVAVNEGIPDIS